MTTQDVPARLLSQIMPAIQQKDTLKADDSQCETMCDEEDDELTEEEYELEGEQDDDDDDDNGNSTEASSTYSMQDSEADDDTAVSASPEIQDLIQEMPELAANYHIVRKVGEGPSCRWFIAYRPRNIQLRVQSSRSQLSSPCECLGF